MDWLRPGAQAIGVGIFILGAGILVGARGFLLTGGLLAAAGVGLACFGVWLTRKHAGATLRARCRACGRNFVAGPASCPFCGALQ